MKKTPKTMNRGASITRAAVIRKIKALRKNALGSSAFWVLDELEGFVRFHFKRTGARKGGLGRK